MAPGRRETHLRLMLVSWIVLLIAVAGLLLWALAAHAILKEAGRIMFFCGLLATCFVLAGKAVRVL